MAKLLLIVSLLLIATVALSSCSTTGGFFPPVAGSENEGGDNQNPEGGDNQNPEGGDNQTPEGGDNQTPSYDVISIAKALELCGAEGNITADRYYIRGTIVTVTNAQYGAMVITDGTDSISVYGTYSADGELTYPQLDYQPVKGDEVLLHCILQNYNGTKEVKNARLIEYKNNQGNVDISDYTEATVGEARDAERGSLVIVEGVVARITYANGIKPSGYILVDNGSSIYVFDQDSAQRVSIGNTVKIAGEKDYWILEKEQSGAKKFGYKGCNQLTNVTLISNDNKTTNFPTSWIESTTVKDILETPVSEDITTLVYKVNALVKKVPGNGFVNYYIFDIDGETGNYTYTQCNGKDFAWLDAFDNKICTVYLTALNAKSSSTGCTFRFLPVAVYDDNYTFDTANAPAYALKYHALDQFLPRYTGNPELELISSVSSSLLGFEGVSIRYASSDETIVKFTSKDGKPVMECLTSGTATVTVTATYNGKSASENVTIKVINPDDYDYVSVKDAIDAQKGATVTVRGIVGPSLVNRDGFYLIDETGIIAVIVNNTSIFSEIEIGHEVILTGLRDLFHNGEGNHAGQIAITGASIDANLYGDNEYNTENFVTDKTLADFFALNVTEQYSNTVFVLKATVKITSTQYYSNIKLTSGSTTVSLYCSSAKQYAFLEQFDGQEITIELAACNWNNKTYYTGCVLAVITEDGKILNTLNFDVY